ncbi:MAG TPA: TonB-dependent receptor, partial [Pyrinomonadaceae bacterium]|nr:TonB-dependent receptor [Pyrinomonadaceae bacterium]
MNIYKGIKILSLICFLAIGIFAQTGATISGKITKDNKPLVETLVLQQNNFEIKRTTSDENGNFKFENLTDGKYRIVVFNTGTIHSGNEPRELTITNSQSVTVDFVFSSPYSQATSSEIKETVTISADSKQTLEEVSKTVNIISGQEMRDRADFALVESLRTIPGFRVQQLGGFGRTASIKTRGLRNQDTAILIDGVRFRDASSITGDASAFLSDFTLTSVSKVEVLRGSGSSLYGTNAIGGTIDFQTPKPESGWHGQFGGAFGGLGLSRFRGNTSYGNSKFGFNVGASRTDYRKGIDGDDDAENTNFQSRIEYNPFENTNISARFFVSDASVNLNSSPDTFGASPTTNAQIINAIPNVNFVADANDPDSVQDSNFFSGQIALTQIINSKLVFRALYSGLRTERKNRNDVLGVGFQSPSSSLFDGTIHTANANFNFTPNRFNEITFGYEFEQENYGNEGFTPSGTQDFFTRVKQSSNTFYAQDLVSAFDGRLQLAGGFRAQVFNLKTPNFSLNNAPYSNLTLENP